jgi:hypothetical protein
VESADVVAVGVEFDGDSRSLVASGEHGVTWPHSRGGTSTVSLVARAEARAGDTAVGETALHEITLHAVPMIRGERRVVRAHGEDSAGRTTRRAGGDPTARTRADLADDWLRTYIPSSGHLPFGQAPAWDYSPDRHGLLGTMLDVLPSRR